MHEQVLNAVVTVELSPAEFSAGLKLERCRLQVHDKMNFFAKIHKTWDIPYENGAWFLMCLPKWIVGFFFECPHSVACLTTQKKTEVVF